MIDYKELYIKAVEDLYDAEVLASKISNEAMHDYHKRNKEYETRSKLASLNVKKARLRLAEAEQAYLDYT
jgi:hypothetical protein